MIYPYRYRASKPDADTKAIEDIIHNQRDYLSDVEQQMRKRQKRLEELE